MERFEGYIDHIIFRNEENGYTVACGIAGGKEYTLVGILPGLTQGETITAQGHEEQHAVYGSQFAITSYQAKTPQTEEAVERYLGSGAVKGIGAALAARIVKHFGADTMRIFSEEPERLSEVKGISRRKAMDIAAAAHERQDVQDAVMYLQGYGISVLFARRIYARYGNALYDLLRENPYRLAEDIEGIAFQRCDEIARRMGIAADSPSRIASCMEFVLLQAEAQGHCYLPATLLKERAEALLSIPSMPEENFHNLLVDMQLGKRIVVKGERVYRAFVYYTELQVAAKLAELQAAFAEMGEDGLTAQEGSIERIANEEGITLDDMQKEAVAAAICHGLLVLTGGPGTGKTTTIRILLRYFAEQGKEILLAAPTGRAAKRMSEATGWEAKTIHRLLEYQGRSEGGSDRSTNGGADSENDGGGGSSRGFSDARGAVNGGNREGSARRGHFERNELYPLEADLIIVDEMSMVDIFLMHALLRAMTQGMRLILVGDQDQLPSVGAGNVLKDIIRSGAVATVRLTRIFRQAAESDIVVNAHLINAGKDVPLGKPSRDFLFIRSGTPAQILEAISALLLQKLPAYLGIDPMEIQVMTPQRKGALGVERLNAALQERLNPKGKEKPEKELFGTLFRLGDKVMQVKNDYGLAWEIRGRYGLPVEKGEGVFNGDIGIITEINNFTQCLTVLYEDRYVEYAFTDCESLELAYAITIHKSQGSEYPAVLMPMYQGPKQLMNRNLLYTAVTRARRLVCLVGNPQSFYDMQHNEAELRRYSSLADRMQEREAMQAEHWLDGQA